jgi:hypothetical protein
MAVIVFFTIFAARVDKNMVKSEKVARYSVGTMLTGTCPA